ncbi:MAG: diaminopimelate decarboxylase [Ignavibacteriae bacterium]|nr:diaminopimelate decarboxylase [Ignavibacteriota bacterium]
MSAFTYIHQSLHCEQRSLKSLALECGTPLYVYSKQALIENCRAIESAFGDIPHLTTYAVKANSNVHLLKIIAAQGLGADVGSKGELFLALQAGIAPDKISVSGVGKRDDEIEYALENNVSAFNVESEQEIDVLNSIAGRMGLKAKILLRLNLDIDAGTHAYISTSKKQNKFGVASSRAVEVLDRAQRLPNIEVRGIHSHLGSQITNVEAFVAAAKALKVIIERLRANNIPVHDLDFGGGFGVNYHGFITHSQLPTESSEGKHLTPSGFIGAVLPILKETECNLAIQPGRTIVATAGVLLTEVLYRKESSDKTFVIVDGGMNDLIRPSLYHAYHQIVPLELTNASSSSVDVVGPCCESGDFFAQDRALPHVGRGDLLAVMCAGAYGFVLSSNYNARLRAAEVLVDGASWTRIRERETLDKLLD